jgi:hypothetical protein
MTYYIKCIDNSSCNTEQVYNSYILYIVALSNSWFVVSSRQRILRTLDLIQRRDELDTAYGQGRVSRKPSDDVPPEMSSSTHTGF